MTKHQDSSSDDIFERVTKSDSKSSSSSNDKINQMSSDNQKNSTDSQSKMLSFIKLKDDAKTEIQFVYHLSDIHIRNTQRHSEYREVFQKTYQKIISDMGSARKTSIIVLTGDIMHTKTELSPESFSIAQEFFIELSKITTLVIIPGNHDCNLSNKDRMDALSPIVSNIPMNNIYYLKKSGIYQLYNIIFGVTSVFDDYLIAASNIRKETWKNIVQKNKYKIALYHGPVHGAKTDVGYRMNNDQLTVDEFEGYDYVLLGDIHKFQYMNKDKTIAYAGSLIQQSYGESLNNHGVLKWDLLDNQSDLLEIKNNYGYCTINIANGQMIPTTIPRKPKIKFVLNNTSQIQYQEIINELEKNHQIMEIVKESTFKTKLHETSPSQIKIKEDAYKYINQESIIKSYLEKKNVEPEVVTEIMNLHHKIYQKNANDKKDQIIESLHNAVNCQKWQIIELQFSNCLSYGKNNVINFLNYDKNKIIGIFAPNHYGKSAILDIILFCLFDKFSRGDRRDIINKNETIMSCSILFKIGSQQYLIERIGKRTKNKLSVKIDVNFYSIINEKNGSQKRESLNGLDRNDTNKKISDLVGNYDDYLTTCICLQNHNRSINFIDMTQTQKKEYLNEILKLNVFEDCHVMAKDKVKKYTTQAKLIEKKFNTESINNISKNIKELKSIITNLECKKSSVHDTMTNELTIIINSLQSSTLSKYHELSNYNLNTLDDINAQINKVRIEISDLHKKIDSKVFSLNDKISSKEHVLNDIVNELNILKQQTKVDDCIDKKNSLVKQLINVPAYDINIVSKLTIATDEHFSRINVIDNILDSKTDDLLSEKITRINELKMLINRLKKELKLYNTDWIKSMTDCFNTNRENNRQIIVSIDNIDKKIPNLSNKDKLILKSNLQLSETFANHLHLINDLLKSYSIGKDTANDLTITSVLKQNNKFMLKYSNWKESVTNILSYDSSCMDIISNYVIDSRNVTQNIIKLCDDMSTENQNQLINKQIKYAENELDSLSEFKGSKTEIDNLKQEKTLLLEKISLNKSTVDTIKSYQNHLANNSTINTEINKLDEIITEYTNKKTKLKDLIANIQSEINQMKKLIDLNNDSINKYNKLKQTLFLLEKYELEHISWSQKDTLNDKWKKISDDMKKNIADLDAEIDKKKIEMNLHKKDLENYLEIRKEFDQVSNKLSMYKLYVQLMNYNGLPYEMLKSYLPLIESDVNQILHSMVNFNIEIEFPNDKSNELSTEKKLKSTVGNININICYANNKPHSAQLASGFERFIIGLSIRMVLCQISMTSKPNFFIIDEGWSCLDSENLSNVSTIMNYIKIHYEHVIIISHLDELKNQTDYVINIDKKDGYSHIKTATTFTKLKKLVKKKPIVVIV